MIHVSGALLRGHRRPECLDTFEQFLFVSWFYVCPNIVLQFVPHVLYRIEIRAFRWSWEQGHVIVFQKLHSGLGGVARSIVLLKFAVW